MQKIVTFVFFDILRLRVNTKMQNKYPVVKSVISFLEFVN